MLFSTAKHQVLSGPYRWLILLSVFVLPGNVWWYRWDITLGICAVELDGTIDVIAPHGRERWIYSPLGIFQVEYG